VQCVCAWARGGGCGAGGAWRVVRGAYRQRSDAAFAGLVYRRSDRVEGRGSPLEQPMASEAIGGGSEVQRAMDSEMGRCRTVCTAIGRVGNPQLRATAGSI
jgi:hypothetical protein